MRMKLGGAVVVVCAALIGSTRCGFERPRSRFLFAMAVGVAAGAVVVVGEADAITPVGLMTEMHHAIPGSRLRIIPDAGHFVQADAPEDCLEVIARRMGIAL